MRTARILNKFPVLSETFILNQIIGVVARGHVVDIYANRPRKINQLHVDIEKYHLLDRTIYFPRKRHHYFLRLMKSMSLFASYFHKNPKMILHSLNIFRYKTMASSLTLLHAAIPFIQKKRYDLIHCHYGPNGLLACYLREIGAIEGKIITSFHGYDLSAYLQDQGKLVYQELFKKGDHFLVVSQQMKNRLIELGCAEQNITVHRQGIDCQKFSFSPVLPPPNRSIRLITIGRLIEKKGVEYGLRAVANLAKKVANIEYIIIGDGKLSFELQELSRKLNIANIVKFIGALSQQEIIHQLKTSHLLLAPSVTSENGDQEGIPNSLKEAMAIGLPVLSTTHSAIPELVIDGESGFLVPERNIDALTNKLMVLIEHPEFWQAMGKAGRRKIEAEYDMNITNDQLIQIYEDVVKHDT